jgi:hypothetical protein
MIGHGAKFDRKKDAARSVQKLVDEPGQHRIYPSGIKPGKMASSEKENSLPRLWNSFATSVERAVAQPAKTYDAGGTKQTRQSCICGGRSSPFEESPRSKKKV